jgi:peptide/nickel transport system ATP-binding protein
MTALLVAEGLARHYAVRSTAGLWGGKALLRAVDGVSLRLGNGRTLGLVGESGCGKTTVAKLVLGLVPPTAGSIRFENTEVAAAGSSGWRALRRRMQMVHQDPLGALDRRIGVGRQILEPLTIHGIGTKAERRERASALMDAVGLQPHMFDRYPHELSGGQRQRVVLARALILEPSLLVCDEPVSALDVSVQAQVINLLLDLQDQLGIAFLFISHDLRVVRQVSHEIAVMYLGRIVEQGTPERLYSAPAHPYTRALLSAIPSVNKAAGRERIVLKGDPPNPTQVPSGCAFRTRCPWAQAECAATRPALKPMADGHLVACHAAHGELAAVAA